TCETGGICDVITFTISFVQRPIARQCRSPAVAAETRPAGILLLYCDSLYPRRSWPGLGKPSTCALAGVPHVEAPGACQATNAARPARRRGRPSVSPGLSTWRRPRRRMRWLTEDARVGEDGWRCSFHRTGDLRRKCSIHQYNAANPRPFI